MNQRLTAAFVAMPMIAVLLALTVWLPLPYVTYRPGPTVDILAAPEGEEIVSVEGQKAYYDDGELRMTTVSVTRRDTRVGLFDVVSAWLDSDEAVYPYELQYPDEGTSEDDQQQGQVQMVTSQDAAIAVALEELGHEFARRPEIYAIERGSAADGALAIRDRIVAIDGTPVHEVEEVVEAVERAGAGTEMTFTVRRDGERVDVPVTPKDVDGQPRIGIQFGQGYIFPFQVDVAIDEAIGGPSAGLMFSLAVYDTLTPGSLTDGHVVAGTGEIGPNGEVGPIGGITQKVAGAREDGVELFLVPADNCADLGKVETGEMRLARVATFDEALDAIETWVQDPDADLPTCEDAA